jgi:hypothetical protein
LDDLLALGWKNLVEDPRVTDDNAKTEKASFETTETKRFSPV